MQLRSTTRWRSLFTINIIYNICSPKHRLKSRQTTRVVSLLRETRSPRERTRSEAIERSATAALKPGVTPQAGRWKLRQGMQMLCSMLISSVTASAAHSQADGHTPGAGCPFAHLAASGTKAGERAHHQTVQHLPVYMYWNKSSLSKCLLLAYSPLEGNQMERIINKHFIEHREPNDLHTYLQITLYYRRLCSADRGLSTTDHDENICSLFKF